MDEVQLYCLLLLYFLKLSLLGFLDPSSQSSSPEASRAVELSSRAATTNAFTDIDKFFFESMVTDGNNLLMTLHTYGFLSWSESELRTTPTANCNLALARATPTKYPNICLGRQDSLLRMSSHARGDKAQKEGGGTFMVVCKIC